LEIREGAWTFNVGSGTGYTVKELMNQMKESTGIYFEAKSMTRRAGDPERLIADISKIKKELGWSPTSTLKEMIDSSWNVENSSA
jgi:UDP-glucose 4-epimerase